MATLGGGAAGSETQLNQNKYTQSLAYLFFLQMGAKIVHDLLQAENNLKKISSSIFFWVNLHCTQRELIEKDVATENRKRMQGVKDHAATWVKKNTSKRKLAGWKKRNIIFNILNPNLKWTAESNPENVDFFLIHVSLNCNDVNLEIWFTYL